MKEKILTLIFPDGDIPAEQEKVIDTLIDIQKTRLSAWLPDSIMEVPSQLGHIIVETVIARYNRIGSEGMAKETVEGHTMEFARSEISDFSEDIDRYLASLNDRGAKERLEFL